LSWGLRQRGLERLEGEEDGGWRKVAALLE